MKIAYCGYDFFQDCLRTLIADGHEILRLFTFDTDNIYNFNTNLLEIAKTNGIPVQTNPVSVEDIENLVGEGVQLFLACAYPYKIPVPDRSDFRGVNLHPSLLPRVRGVWPLPVVLLKERDAAGLTLHKLAPKWDAGDILIQKPIPLSDEDDLESYSLKSMREAPALLRELLSDLEDYWANATPQSSLGGGSYYTYPPDDDKTFDFSKTVDEIDRIGRAFGRFESLAVFDGIRYWIKDYSVWHEDHSYPCGTIVVMANREWLVAAKDGFVCLKDFYKEKPAS